jgi:hypothetical protein
LTRGYIDMGVQERFDLWKAREERRKYLGPMPLCALPSTMLEAMRAVKREMNNAYEVSERRDCERRLRRILELYEAYA